MSAADSEQHGELLISDSDRDQISEVLCEHMAEGRLTEEELEQRVGRVLACRTRAEAEALVADLPALEAPLALPAWLAAADIADARPQTGAPSRAQQRAAERKRAKHHEDENAIGHDFQARRRTITTRMAAASAAGNREEVRRLGDELRTAKETAAAARQALAAGDRAELQRQLARLRTDR